MRPTPFRAVPPRNGRQWTVVDADGKEVCECDGPEDGKAEAACIAAALNGVQLVREAKALHQAVACTPCPPRDWNAGVRISHLMLKLRDRILRRARAL